MPNIKSQKDRVVQAKKEALHNKAIKSNLKTVIKKADAAIDSNAADKAALMKAAVSAIDSARARVLSIKTPLPARSAAWPSATTRSPRSNLRTKQRNNARCIRSGHFSCLVMAGRFPAAWAGTGGFSAAVLISSCRCIPARNRRKSTHSPAESPPQTV